MSRKSTFIALLALIVTIPLAARDFEVQDISVTSADNTADVSFRVEVGKKATRRDYKMVLTPVIYNASHQQELTPIIVETKRSRIMDARMQLSEGDKYIATQGIKTVNGGTVDYAVKLPVESWMDGAALKIEVKYEGCCLEKDGDAVKMAENLPLPIVTGQIEVIEEIPVFTPPAGITPYVADFSRKWEFSSQEMIVDFRLRATVIDTRLNNNARTLDEIVDAIKELQKDEDTFVSKIKITGSSSPEGATWLNTSLGEKRAVALKEYVSTRLTGLADEIFDLENIGENWKGLRSMVERSSMPGRDKVLEKIDSYDYSRNSEGLENALRTLDGGEPYRYMLRNFFPKLRNACYVEVHYKADSDVAAAAVNKAVGMIRQGNYKEALDALLPHRDDSASWNAIGVCNMMTGEYGQAKEYFVKAAAQGDENAKLNLKLLENIK